MRLIVIGCEQILGPLKNGGPVRPHPPPPGPAATKCCLLIGSPCQFGGAHTRFPTEKLMAPLCKYKGMSFK